MFDVPKEWTLPAVKTANVESKTKKRRNRREKPVGVRSEEPVGAEEKHRRGRPVGPVEGKNTIGRVQKPSQKHTDQKFVQSKSKSLSKQPNDLSGARFRYLNEKLYTMDSKTAISHFHDNPKDFERYHEGFAKQVASWPANPVDLFIKRLLRLSKKKLAVVDLGCGEGKLGQACKEHHNVSSFDLVALHPHIQVGDMCNLPTIPTGSVDIVIFCLSLMNTNFVDALKEAHRMLKAGGAVWIAEVASRFGEGPDSFAKGVSKSFKLLNMNLDNPVFALMDFEKVSSASNNQIDAKKAALAPCLYKKR